MLRFQIQSSSASAKAVDSLIVQSEKIAQLLQLKDGIFHVQFILNNGNPVIIEICRRPPGDLYIQLVSIATCIDYPSWIVKGAAGMNCDEIQHGDINGLYTRHCIMGARDGTLQGINIDEDVESSIVERMTWWNKGQIVEDYLTEKYGVVFIRHKDENSMNKTLKSKEQFDQLKLKNRRVRLLAPY